MPTKKTKVKIGLKKNPDGTYTVSSEEGAKRALQLQAEIKASVNEVIVDATELTKAVGVYMSEKHKEVIVYDKDRYARLVTNVTRTWDTDKLEKLLPKGIFRKVTKRVADAAKIDEFVAKEEIQLKKIEKAFVEKPGKPYVRTYVGDPNKETDE